jgi:hypothetical protein
MPGIDGSTLRVWRRERRWDVPEMARQLRHAACKTGQTAAALDGLIRMIYAWERGDHVLSERYELLYAAALQIEPHRLQQPPDDPVTRQEDICSTSPAAQISAGDVAVIRGMLDSLTASDRQFGGGHALAYAMDYLQTIVMPRVNARGDLRVLHDLYAVTVEFNLRAASMQLDAGHASESRRLVGTSFPLAQETGSPILAAWVLSRCGEQHLQDGMIEQALAYTSAAAAMSARSAPRARSFVLIKNALALSATGERTTTLRAVGDAWDAYHRAGNADEPAWMRAYGVEHLQHDEGRCLNNLGLGDQAVLAADRSLQLRTLSRPRAFTLAVKTLGHAQGSAPDLDAACVSGHELLALMAEIASDRVLTQVAKVLRALRPYQVKPAVSDLFEAARPLVDVHAQ